MSVRQFHYQVLVAILNTGIQDGYSAFTCPIYSRDKINNYAKSVVQPLPGLSGIVFQQPRVLPTVTDIEALQASPKR